MPFISWTELIKEEPDNPPLYRFSGDAYAALKKYDLAIADYVKYKLNIDSK